MSHTVTDGPGPHERKLRNRILFRLTGHWPQSVVRERLAAFADLSGVRTVMKDVYWTGRRIDTDYHDAAKYDDVRFVNEVRRKAAREIRDAEQRLRDEA